MRIDDIKIAIFADGANVNQMMELYKKGFIKGFTTNPTLMKEAGIRDYKDFAKQVIEQIPDRPISFEVFADDFETMEKEAMVLSQYGKNIFVKIPIINSKGESNVPLISRLSQKEIHLNITAVFTVGQVEAALNALKGGTDNIISVFAGRIADTGIDPEIVMRKAAELCRQKEGTKSLWASSREIFNIIQAERCGVDIITVTNELLTKLIYIGKDLEQFSLETVQMFVKDGRRLGLSIIDESYETG